MGVQSLPSNPHMSGGFRQKVQAVGVWLWNVGRCQRNLRYAAAWLLGFITGVWMLIALAQRSSEGGRFAWEKTDQWPWLTQLLDQLTNAPAKGSYNFVNALSSWLIVWTLVLCTVWLFLRPAETHPCRRARLRYLIIWIVGLVVLIPGLHTLITIVVPAAASNLLQFTNLFPLLIIWTICIFLLFLYLGDSSDAYDIYLVPYRAVWTVLSVVILSAVLTGYAAYQGVRARVDGNLSARTLARTTTQQLQEATNALLADVVEMTQRLDAFETIAQDVRARAAQEGSPEARQSAERSINNARAAMVDDLLSRLPLMVQDAASAHGRAQATLVQIQHAQQQQSGQMSSSLQHLEVLINETITTTAALPPVIDRIAIALRALQVPDHESYSLVALRTLIGRDLIGPAQDASRATDVLARSMVGIDFTGLSIFLWIGALYVVLILFPWILHLLFLYRKRRSRAAQILDDLTRLDPSHALLKRVLRGYTAQHKQEEKELRELLHGLQPNASLLPNLDKYIEALANRAFSTIEYMLSLIMLSLLIAVGWYYVFYPQTTLGLATLIQNGAGVGELSSYIVANLTPLTLGFVGAYFFIIQMLVRRYLADDLYPSAFTQSAQRLVLVFILSLTLSIVGSVSASQIQQNVEQGSAPLPTPTFLLLAAFFAGVYPHAGLRLVATLVNTWAKQLFSIKRKLLPETLVPEPLTLLTGVTVWTEARLLEENVENVQSMATAPIEQLVLGTHFATAQIIDWVDQSILYLHAGHNGEWFCRLRAVGICSAYGLLDAITPAPITTGMLAQELKPDPAGIARIVRAVSAATATVDCSDKEPISPQSPAVSTTAPATEDASVAQQRALTDDILHAIFDTIRLDPNLWYIVNFHCNSSQMSARAVRSPRSAGAPALSPSLIAHRPSVGPSVHQ